MRPQILVFLCWLFLLSCNKKETPEYVQCYPLMPSPHLIAEETFYHGPDTTFVKRLNYIYDETGRLLFKISTRDGITDTVEKYTYYSDKILVNSSTYLLNEQGLATSNNNLINWKYSAGGYLTEELVTYGGGTYTSFYYYTCYNAEQVVIKHQTSLGTYTDTTTYLHYTDKANTIGNENHGIHFLGRQDNTLPKTIITGGQTVNSYTYLFDSMNRVLWETQIDLPGNINYRKFTYL